MDLYTEFYNISFLKIRYYYLLKLTRLGENANQLTVDSEEPGTRSKEQRLNPASAEMWF